LELESLVLLASPGSDHSSEASSQSSGACLLLGQHKSSVSGESDTTSSGVVDEEFLSVVLGSSDLDLMLVASDVSSDVEDSSSTSS